MPFQILHNDITNMETDAIVNAANSNLIAGGGVCGAIFSKAGKDELQKECNLLSPCPVGHAVQKGTTLNLNISFMLWVQYTKMETQEKKHILKVPIKIR